MQYIEMFGGTHTCDQLIFEPEDWSEEEWKTILKIFGMEKAERIVLADYAIEAYGQKKERDSSCQT